MVELSELTFIPTESSEGVFMSILDKNGSLVARLGPLEANQAVQVPEEENPWARKERKHRTRYAEQKRRSAKREEKVAQALGGRVQPASGALPTKKSDIVKRGAFRVEHKYTDAQSYRLTLGTLHKVEGEAEPGEVPIVVVEFTDPKVRRPLESYAVLSLHNLEKMLNAYLDAKRPTEV